MNPLSLNRRELLRSLAGGLSTLALGGVGEAQTPSVFPHAKLGLVTYCLDIHQKSAGTGTAGNPLATPLGFLEECHRLGAAGMQFPLGAPEPAVLAELRRKAEDYGMYIEANLNLPRDAADLERFERQVRAAKAAGAALARVVMLPGRRYEQFNSLDEFQQACRSGLASLQLAEPVAARHGVRLAVENHKDHRVAEKLEVLRRLSSEFVGLCVDVINNLALAEDPLEVVKAFAPWALTVHLKDAAVRECAEGFLLTDAALGTGFLDLPAIVRILRAARPEARFNLEVITRDPLLVPVLTPKYWATMPGVPAAEWARVLSIIRAKASPAPLPLIAALPPDQQLAAESRNVAQSLAWAREGLA